MLAALRVDVYVDLGDPLILGHEPPPHMLHELVRRRGRPPGRHGHLHVHVQPRPGTPGSKAQRLLADHLPDQLAQPFLLFVRLFGVEQLLHGIVQGARADAADQRRYDESSDRVEIGHAKRRAARAHYGHHGRERVRAMVPRRSREQRVATRHAHPSRVLVEPLLRPHAHRRHCYGGQARLRIHRHGVLGGGEQREGVHAHAAAGEEQRRGDGERAERLNLAVAIRVVMVRRFAGVLHADVDDR
mmetsp:Transcript_83491/g.235412  ORF Transcript_83491/g.235412 Transcript_83491/m.235412 type:complete len:244 (+) Transcript_83491:1778-2509(+)